MKKLVEISRIIVGLTFIISSVLKGFDPVGSSYTFALYLDSLFHVKLITSLALPLTIALIIVEFTLGVMLLARLLVEIAAWAVTFVIVFFWFVSLYLAIEKGNVNCGCYGDFIHLTMWQAFYKNSILIVLTLIIFFNRKKIRNYKLNPRYQLSWTLTLASLITAFVFINYTFLPLIDLSPFKVGTNLKKLKDSLHIIDKHNFETKVFYQNINTKDTVAFSIDSIPWQDSLNWKWVKTETKIKHKPQNPYENFKIITLKGKDITDSLLSQKTPILLIIAYDLERMNFKGFLKVLAFSREFTDQYFPIAYCLTASPQEVIDSIVEISGAYEIEFCHTDENVLKQMIRTNPGIIILKDGTIIAKRSYNNLPKLKRKNYYMQ